MLICTISKESFPIRNIQDVVNLFRKHLQEDLEPNLAILSIVVGFIENNLTSVIGGKPGPNDKESSVHLNKLVKVGFPELSYEEAESLYNKFSNLIKNSFDSKSLSSSNGYATREVIKKVSDVIWNSLTRSYYKDRAHLQSIYSYLNGKKLDCFGVAFAVVAGCQVLGFTDVHLALSEDHAWVVFGKGQLETAEVTWHGKGNEDKRGQPIGLGTLSKSWLYVAGFPVVCSRQMEVAALVSSINPSLTLTTDVYEIALLQQHLLWVLYDLGHLSAYPMALGNLGELEEYCRFNDGKERPDCADLYFESIQSARKNYLNRHVYPYTFQGAYFFRNKMYKEAFGSWADAGDVIRTYNYSRDDEEIYKEFLEIANELIPQIMKIESSGHSARSILKDSQCFAYLLRFYDGICKWEEESQTPILHIGWAKPLVNTISKFDADVRAQVNIVCCEESDVPEESDITNIPADKIAKGGESNAPQNDSSTNIKQESSCSSSDKDKTTDNSELPTDIKSEDKSVKTLSDSNEDLTEHAESANNPKIFFYSHKMKGLKNLLLSEKLNTHAISLHLTAQSQVFVNKKIGESSPTSAQLSILVSIPERAAPRKFFDNCLTVVLLKQVDLSSLTELLRGI